MLTLIHTDAHMNAHGYGYIHIHNYVYMCACMYEGHSINKMHFAKRVGARKDYLLLTFS